MTKTKNLTTLAMMAAMASLVMLIRIPTMPGYGFLTYDPKDVIIVIGGFMFGPLAAVTLAAVSSFIEMVTVSETAGWGFLMNFTSSVAFAVPAAFVYKMRRTLGGAVAGLCVGVAVVVPVMLAWNWLVVPIYTGWPREAVVPLLAPVFLPFNLIKYGLNAALAMLVYKPVVNALIAAGLYKPAAGGKGRVRWLVVIVSALIAVSISVVIFVMQWRHEEPEPPEPQSRIEYVKPGAK